MPSDITFQIHLYKTKKNALQKMQYMEKNYHFYVCNNKLRKKKKTSLRNFVGFLSKLWKRGNCANYIFTSQLTQLRTHSNI